ncbi:MAG: S8 family peptidase [Magnetospirillum sp.]|nr:S8 family peptidase [Magnetospirillum sp.]
MERVLSSECADLNVPVTRPDKGVMSVLVAPDANVDDFRGDLNWMEKYYGARIRLERRYQLDDDFLDDPIVTDSIAASPEHPSLDDVLDQLNAREAWNKTRGKGTVIAVVDTGIDGSRPEFGVGRRLPGWAPKGQLSWEDYQGHGTMCAAIAAGSRADGGEFDGVAPEATLFSGRSQLWENELAAIYDELAGLADTGKAVVASNSFGLHTGKPPRDYADEFLDAVDHAISRGVHVFFSAGNNHHLTHGAPDGSGPNSIWTSCKNRADVITVGTCKLDGSMWPYSSRGPGQYPTRPASGPKPDVIGPTPANGRIVYGPKVVTKPNGWGTSGACPQAAGLAALLLSAYPGITGEDLRAAIRQSAFPLNHPRSSQGHGRIHCGRAVAHLDADA